MSECPGLSELNALLNEQLASDLANRLEQHLASCASCQVRLDALTDVEQRLGLAVERDDLSTVSDEAIAIMQQLSHDGPPALPALATEQDSPALLHQQLSERFSNIVPLGYGGAGQLYRASDERLRRDVAIKVLHGGIHTAKSARARLEREARSIAALDHENIVRVHDVELAEGAPAYFVMELVPGEDLRQRIARDGAIPARLAAEVARDIARALHAAHESGLIHRDVKPSNILCDDRNHKFKLTDFGLVLEQDSEATQLTHEGTLAGTPDYMSPEQVRNPHEVQHSTDIYSLGVVLYEMLTGVRPFGGAVRMTLLQILNDDPRNPRLVAPHVPRDLETICLKAMSKEPTLRYDSAKSLEADIDNWLNDRPISARPVGALGRLTRWYRRNPKVAGLVSAVALLLACLAVGATLSALSVSRARSSAEESAMKFQWQRNIALTTLKGMVFDVSDRMDVFDATTDAAHETLLNSAIDGLEQLQSQQSDDVAVQLALMAAYARKGGLLYQTGNEQTARTCLDEAIRMGKAWEGLELDSVDPGTGRDRVQSGALETLSLAHWYMAQLANDRDEHTEAEEHMLQSLKLDKTVHRSWPTPESRSAVLATLHWLVDFYAEAGSNERALDLGAEAIAMNNPVDALSDFERTSVRLKIAELELQNGNSTTALEHAIHVNELSGRVIQSVVADFENSDTADEEFIDVTPWEEAIDANRIIEEAASKLGDVAQQKSAALECHRLFADLKRQIDATHDEVTDPFDLNSIEASLPKIPTATSQ